MFAKVVIILSLISGAALAAPGDIAFSFASPSSCPSGLAFDGTHLWMADFKTDTLYEIDPENGKVIRAMPAPSYRPYGMAWDGSHLWIVDGEENNIIQFDIESGINVWTIPSPVDAPTGLTWDGNDLWLADKKTIRKISVEDGTTIEMFKSPSGNTTGLAFDGKYIWSADRGKNRLYMIYPETGEVVNILDSPAPYAWGLTFADDKLYNVDYQADSLYQIVVDDDEFFVKKNRQRQNMNFTHEIRNYGPGTLKSLDIYLAIPENSDHQTLTGEPVYFADVSPEYLIDKWGQPYAAFHYEEITSGQKVRAEYYVTADLYEIRYFIRPENVGNLKDIPKEIRGKFLADDTKFDLNNPVIQNAVKEAVGDEINPYWMARKIYRWVNDTLYYELSGGWNVAPAIIERGNGSCSEYTFVFMSMCRAAGVPARYTGAISVRGDRASEDEVFHRWCEIYLPPYGWIPVDPSRGDSESPEGQANGFGSIGNGLLVTTTGAGSDFIGWNYNSGEKWESVGICKIVAEHIGEWTPADTTAEAATIMMPGGQLCKPKR